MKYNDKYDLYIDDDLVIYYWNKKKDKLMQRTISKNNGYLQVVTKIGRKYVHRVIYETFVGPIPDCYEIDHINTIKTDNRLDNLRCVTHAENNNNPLTRKHNSETMKGNTNGKGNKGKPTSAFGRKFKEHYGIISYQNSILYNKERNWYLRNGKCSWE